MNEGIAFFEAAPGRRLAFRRGAGRGPILLFLPGYRSDMTGSKASALDAWAAREGRAMLRFDYAGCGASPGAFEAQDLDGWLGDALAMIDMVEGPLLLIGSSMGGWIMLLAALARPERIAGLVGLAAAPDFTDWGFDDAQKARLRETGRLELASAWSDEPEITTRAFWESGERHKLLAAPIPIHCPVRLLHGLADRDVPWSVSVRLAERLLSADVRTVLIKDGDHRLSRDGDIAALVGIVAALAEDKDTGHYVDDKA